MKRWLKILFMIYTIQSSLIEAIKKIMFGNKNNRKDDLQQENMIYGCI